METNWESRIVKATDIGIEEFITDDAEWREIFKDLINGDYTIEALRQDFAESIEQGNITNGEAS